MQKKSFWFHMGNRPLEFDVRTKGKVVAILAGTKHVDIAFGKSFMTYKTEDGSYRRLNMYRWNGKIVHGR